MKCCLTIRWARRNAANSLILEIHRYSQPETEHQVLGFVVEANPAGTIETIDFNAYLRKFG
jgi:hypothetical protein